MANIPFGALTRSQFPGADTSTNSAPGPSNGPDIGPYRLINAHIPICLLPLAHTGAKGGADKLCSIDIDANGVITALSTQPHKIKPGESGSPDLPGTNPLTGTEPDAADANGTPFGDAIPVIDLGGRVVTSRLVDAHVHLDKTMTWRRAPNHEGTFEHAKNVVKHDRAQHWTPEDVYARASRALTHAYAHGVDLMRTHVDSQPGRRDPAWPVLIALQKEWAGRIDIQFVASLGSAKLMDSYGDDIAAFAAAHGALLGPVVYHSSHAEAEVQRAFDLAERYGLNIDFHVDENLMSSSDGVVQVSRAILERDFKGSVVCGHLCAVSMKTEEEVEWIATLIKQANVNIIALPAANAFLLDRRPVRSPRLRGLAPIKELHARGVAVSVASDNCQDAFNPSGDFNPIDVFSRAVIDGHLDAPLAPWLSMVTTTPRQMLSGEPGLIKPGAPANLVVFDVTASDELVARPSVRRWLLRNGWEENTVAG